MRVLGRTEVRSVENLLQSEDLDAAPAGLLDQRDVRVDGRLAYLLDRQCGIGERGGGLNQPAEHGSGHPRL